MSGASSQLPQGGPEEETAGGILVEDLQYAYPRGGFRLALASWRVAPGEALALVGPSGSGKTTLLELLAGIRLPHRGRVVADGFEWARHPDAARRRRRIARVGLVFQEFELLDHLTVGENVLLPYLVSPALALDAGARDRARDLAQRTAIADHLDRRPRQLSHGERQRVALCRALVTRPTLVLADEPTGNLDPEAGRLALDLLVQAVRERDGTLVVVTHDRSLHDAFDRVVDLARLTGGAANGATSAATGGGVS